MPSFGGKIVVKAVEASYLSTDVDDVETEDGNSDEVVVRLSLFSVVRVRNVKWTDCKDLVLGVLFKIVSI